MAKGGVSGKNGRDSKGRRLGIKHYQGELVDAGNIIVRQRGSHFKAGLGAGQGTDFTIFAKVKGKVAFANRVINVVDVH